ncbi:MAG: metallophosphoesterase [Lachnospiraceae bacterium]|nr:metallophosphoesterase [Lachnospiraceae bacterium]
MRRIKAILACACLLLMCACTNCENGAFGDAGYTVDEVNLKVGLDKPIKLIVINDLHLQINNDEISLTEKETMTARVKDFTTGGLTTEKRWKKLPALINKEDADYVLFAGDMLDFNSEATVSALREGVEKIEKPLMYVRADHDIENYWQDSSDYWKSVERQSSISDNSALIVAELDEIILMGINYSQNNVSRGTVDAAREIMSRGKPVIVVTHVPIGQETGTELQTYSEEVRGGRRLYWAPGASNEPNAEMAELLGMIYADDSPVVAVLAGHLHAKWEGKVSENAIEHIFAPCFQGNVGIVNIE